jgi:hypothetical protein
MEMIPLWPQVLAEAVYAAGRAKQEQKEVKSVRFGEM